MQIMKPASMSLGLDFSMDSRMWINNYMWSMDIRRRSLYQMLVGMKKKMSKILRVTRCPVKEQV